MIMETNEQKKMMKTETTLLTDCGSQKLPHSTHKRTLRLIVSQTDAFLRRAPPLWGIDRQEACMWALRAVCEKCPLGKAAVKNTIYKALRRLLDESEKNHIRLVPASVRAAEQKAKDAGLDRDRLMQNAYLNYTENVMLYSQQTTCRLIDSEAVRLVLRGLSEEDRTVCRRHLKCGSVKKAATSVGMSEKSYERHVWEPTRMRFRELWKQIDQKNLAEALSSNPSVFGGGSLCCLIDK